MICQKSSFQLMRLRDVIGSIGLLLALSRCGSGEMQINRPGKSGAELRISTEVRDLGNGQVEVTARPSLQIIGGSFTYCLSSIELCQSQQNYQLKMVPVDGGDVTMGAPTIVTHKIPQIIDSSKIQQIAISAKDLSSAQVIWLAVRLDSRTSPEEQTSEIQNQVSPPVNTAVDRFQFDRSTIERSSQKIAGVDFDYKYGQQNIHPNQPKIRAKITNQSILSLRSNVGVILGGYALNNSSKYIAAHTAVIVDSQGGLSLVGDNLSPATIYKMRLHFYDRSDRTQAQPRYLGSSSRTYNFVTDGVNDPETKIRARIVMRGLAEESDWDLNRYDRSKNYTHGAGGWCHIFYNWVIKPYLKTRTGSENTHYSQSYWSSLGAVKNGAALVEMSSKEPIMGDYFRVGSHAAMILAYDVAKKQFATLEGNFNNSVEFYQRSAGNLGWVGHINPQMLKDAATQQLQ
ncbi:MAG: hypothetical protein WCL28_09090 [bacterium]